MNITDTISEFFISQFPTWFLEHGIMIIAVIVGAFIVNMIFRIGIEKLVRKMVTRPDGMSHIAEEKREDTLIKVFRGTFSVVLWTVVLLMLLSEFGVEIGPLIAGLGILGVAIGFGGQYLVRDIITGLFLIMENQYRVGDVIKINGVSGTVEDISLRITRLRDIEGVLHTVPNGEIKLTSNMTTNFSKITMELGVGYGADIDHVEEVVNTVGQDLANDDKWSGNIKSPLEFLRIQSFGDSSVNVRVVGTTTPGDQWSVAGEFRRRIKKAFEKEGIEIPYPHIVIQK